ncbi:MAG: hypothetical protein H6Q73_3889 [Firmicutes bacterium]|nr:hypothetical protein [Bacillota bacterium]
MKKIVALTFLFLFALTSLALASEAKWHLIEGKPNNGVYVETTTIKSYGKEGDKYLNFWHRYDVPKKGHILVHCNLRTNNLNFLELDYFVYDNNGKLINRGNGSKNGWYKVKPGSKTELLMKKTVLYYNNR